MARKNIARHRQDEAQSTGLVILIDRVSNITSVTTGGSFVKIIDKVFPPTIFLLHPSLH